MRIYYHKNPDADCVGAAMALAEIKKGQVFGCDTVPEHLKWMGKSTVSKEAVDSSAIVVDARDDKKLGLVIVGSVKELYDHHEGSTIRFSEAGVVDPSATSTCELLARTFGVATFSRHAAKCLLAGIWSDSFGLTDRRVTPQTLRLVAELCDRAECSLHEINGLVEARPSLEMIRLKASFQSSIEMVGDWAVGFVSNNDKLLQGMNPARSMTGGFMELVKQLSPSSSVVKAEECCDQTVISLVSERYDCAAIAAQFGGKGNRRSARFEIWQPLKDALKCVLEALPKQ